MIILVLTVQSIDLFSPPQTHT
ncbi:Protein of unknown function [Pyronema omphalodes CBS 100304]|uniref:Uncharacterized protein n=1 Tax=Pyronema omphalodes (strain CBS 100304) TaxID=1076935 RepID=U4L601_PYROM|nr:Protein of unknown function [Pyronema omphalodes CBS 100304]